MEDQTEKCLYRHIILYICCRAGQGEETLPGRHRGEKQEEEATPATQPVAEDAEEKWVKVEGGGGSWRPYISGGRKE